VDAPKLIIMGTVAAALALTRKVGQPARTLLAYGALGVLGATRAIPPLAAVSGAALAGAMHLGFYLFKKREEASIKDHVLEMGIRVDEVERDLPYTSAKGSQMTIQRGRSTRYSIPRLGSTAPASWSFLMRTKKDGAQFPHGFLFRTEGGEPPPQMREVLTRIARDSDQEYLEFEATPSEISAYWDAWGGMKQFNRVHAFMQRLAAF
jgi:hypothetical protein